MNNQELVNDVLNDVVQVGTMLVVSRALMANVDANTSLSDNAWIKSSVYTLLGFTAYHVFTKQFFKTDGQTNDVVKAVMDDWLKVGTMMVVTQMLSQGPFNKSWMRTASHTLLGFTMYQVFTKHLVPVTAENAVMQDVMNDWLKVGTMLVFSRFLSGQAFDNQWMQESLFTLLGFTAYQTVTKKLLDKQ